jgi:DNA transposition AAA+ family ATPase
MAMGRSAGRPLDNDPNHWAQRLAEQARILGEARMLRDEQPLTDELTKAVIARFKEYLARAQKSETWAAKSVGIASSTLNQVVNGTYAGDVEKMVRQLDKWLEQQILREQAPKPGGFVKTRVAEQIYGVARWIQKINAIGLVHGPAGVGKSITAQAVRAETPGSLFISITTAGQSKLAVLEALARAMRLTGLTLTANNLFNLLVEELKDTNRLVIVDEVHKLEGRRKDEALHTLRDLHDQTGCPMLWLGMTNIANYIQQGKTKFEPLDQIASRIKFWLNLTAVANGDDGGPGLYTIDDVRRWLAAQKIRVADDAVRYLQMIANEPQMGGLRTCDGLLRVARVLAGDAPITADLLRSIFADQRGLKFVESFEQQVEIRQAAVG